MEFTAEMIAGFLGGEIAGDKDAKVWTVAKIEEGTEGALAFFSNPKYEQHVYTSKATIIIVNRDFEPREPVGATMIKVDDAYACFAKLLQLYAENRPRKTGIRPTAIISDNATLGTGAYVGEYTVISDGVTIGDNAEIHPQVWIGDRVKIGDNVKIYPGVKIYEECVIGNNVTLHSGAVIGADGFGFAPNEKGEFDKIPQIGNVVIEDNVDIGANTCVDRATMGSTYIRRGVKLDNLIQIGHNASVGENTVCAAQVGIAGSTKVGASCMMGGQVGIAGHLNIGDRALFGSQTGVPNSLPGDQSYLGTPPLPGSKFHRSHAIFRKLPELSNEVAALRKEVDKLKETAVK